MFQHEIERNEIIDLLPTYIDIILYIMYFY